MSNAFKVRPAAGYEKTHLVTSDGRIFVKTLPVRPKMVNKRFARGHWLKPQFNGRYYHVSIGRPKITKTLHRIIANTFVPNPQNHPFVNHKDGDKRNNTSKNLEWCTSSENMQHAYKNKLIISPIGDARYWSTKIPDKELPTIKSLYLRGYSQKHIAKIYSVDQSHISRIVNNHKRGRIMPSVTR